MKRKTRYLNILFLTPTDFDPIVLMKILEGNKKVKKKEPTQKAQIKKSIVTAILHDAKFDVSLTYSSSKFSVIKIMNSNFDQE